MTTITKVAWKSKYDGNKPIRISYRDQMHDMEKYAAYNTNG
jgi:hypothetical protein